jgi:hypothetical protein
VGYQVPAMIIIKVKGLFNIFSKPAIYINT